MARSSPMARRRRWWRRRSCRKRISVSAKGRRTRIYAREGFMPFVLDSAEPGALGLRVDRLGRLCAMVEAHIKEGRYPGAQIAVARHGKLALCRSFGAAALRPPPGPGRDGSLWRVSF